MKIRETQTIPNGADRRVRNPLYPASLKSPKCRQFPLPQIIRKTDPTRKFLNRKQVELQLEMKDKDALIEILEDREIKREGEREREGQRIYFPLVSLSLVVLGRISSIISSSRKLI